MRWAVAMIAVVILAVVCDRDLRTRRIPNELCLSIAILGMLRLAAAQDPADVVTTLTASAGMFVVTCALYWRGTIGGGDAKLMTAMALLIGYRELPNFLLLMSLCGGVLALAVIAHRRLAQQSAPHDRLCGEAAPAAATVPYGVAIAAAGVMTLINGW